VPRPARQASCQRFSLMEMIMVLLLLGIIGAGAGQGIAVIVRSHSQAVAHNASAQQVRNAMSRVRKELRQTQAPPTIAANNHSISFTARHDDTDYARTLSWNGTAGAPLLLDNDILLDKVTSFHVSSPDAAALQLSLTVAASAQPFTVRVYPRYLVP